MTDPISSTGSTIMETARREPARGVPFKLYVAGLLLAVAVPLTAGLGWVTYRDFEKSMRDAQTIVLRSAQLSAARTASFLRESREILQTLSSYPQLRALDREQCGSVLETVNELLPYHANATTRDIAGSLVCTAVPPVIPTDTRAADSTYLRKVIDVGGFVIGDPVVGRIINKWVVALAYPLRDIQDNVAGVVVLAVDLAKFFEIASSVALVNGTVTHIITGDGIVVASSTDGETAVGRDVKHSDVLRRIAGETDSTMRLLYAGTGERIYGMAAVPGTDWHVYAGIPAQAVFANSRHELERNLLIVSVILAVSILCSVALARKVVASVDNIAGVAAAVATGSKLARAEPAGPRELKLVATQLNSMLDVLGAAEARLSGIIASAMDPIITIDREQVITLVNPAVELMFGYREADLLGKPVSILLPERFRENHAAHIQTFAQTNTTHRRMGGFGQVVGRRASGEEFPLDASISQMQVGGQQLFTVIMRDVARRIEAEKALLRNYQILDRIFETTHFCVVYLDPQLNFVRVNKAYADAFGHPPEFFTGKNHAVLFPAEKIGSIFREAITTRRPFTVYADPFEFPEHPEWGVTSWDWTVHPLLAADGAVEGLLLALLDVTGRTRAVHALERKTAIAQLLETLARTANEAGTPEEALRLSLRHLCDFSNWTIGRVTMTRELGGDLELSGVSVWDAVDIGRHVDFIRTSEDVRNFPLTGSFIGAVVRDRQAVWFSDIGEVQGFFRKEAALANGLRTAFAFPVVVQSKVVAFLEFFADAPRAIDTGLIEATETIAAQLARSIERSRADRTNAQLAAIVASSNDAIVMRGLDHEILSWNAAAERLFGWSAQEAIGRSIDLIAPRERDEATRPPAERLTGEETAGTLDAVYLRKDGSRVAVQLTVSPVRDKGGEIVAHSLLLRDISELKRNQEALERYATRLLQLSQRLREVEESERNAISRELHDRIGQGLSTLSLMVGTLEARLSGESRAAVGTQLKDMQSLVRSVIAHVRDVMADLRPPALDDYGLLAALRHFAGEFARRTGIAVGIAGADLNPRLSIIVETALFRIAQEALNNVAKHAHATRIEIALRSLPDRIVLDIADDGVGIASSAAAQAGTSWGMTTMRERAEVAGIVFRVETAGGSGTRVVLEVERATA